jgi:hypothetical protein
MTNWTSAHRLDGIAYIAAHYQWERHGMWSGVPQLTVQVRGRKVYDPRDSGQTFGDTSTYEWSDNPALCFLDFISNNEYGKGLTASQLNLTTFGTAATTADTLQHNPYYNGVEKSFTWSGTSGSNFILVSASGSGGLHWWQNKVGELFTLEDSSGNIAINSKAITAVERTHFYGQGVKLQIYFAGTLSANYAEQTGTALAKVRRFHCHGLVDTNKTVMENAKELLANMRGIFLYIDGKYELQIEDIGSSTFTITDDHIIADAGISVDYGNKDKKANKVIVEFFNANKKYELDTVTVLHDASPEYYSDDNDEILEIKAEFPYVSDPYIAYNMGKAILVRSRKQKTIQFLGTPEMYKLNVGDIVTLNYAGTFDTSQTCRVEALELQSDGLVAVSLIEYFDVYTWETPPQEPLEDLADLPSAYAVKAPTGLAFTDTDSSAINRPFLSWDEPTDFPDYQYRVNVVDSSSNQVLNRIVDVTSVDLNFIPKGTNYVASVTSLNVLGAESSPATLTFTVADEPTVAADIADDAITTDKLADDAVTTAKIINDAVTNALIATDAVNQDSIAANAVTATEIVAGTITTSEIAASTITSANIAANTIVADDIATETLTSESGVFGSISAGDIDTGTLNADNVTISGGDVTINSSGITINGSSSSINLGSGAFTVSSAGVMTATGATISGAITATSGSFAGSLNSASGTFTGALSGGTISIGSGNSIFKADSNGIYLGNTTFGSAPFRVTPAGALTATNADITGDIVANNLNISSATVTGTLSADNIQIDDVTLDSDGSGNLIIKSGGVDTAQIKDDAVTNDKVESLSATKLSAGEIDADEITVVNFTADNIEGDIDKLEPVNLTPNYSLSTSYALISTIRLSAPDILTADGGHTPFFSFVISATQTSGGLEMDLKVTLYAMTVAGDVTSFTTYTAAESGQDHNFNSGPVSQSISGSFNQKVYSYCDLKLYAKRNAGSITLNKIQGVYAGLRAG